MTQHIRNNRPVHAYLRGKGKQPLKEPSLKHTQTSRDFNVTIKYLDESANEKFTVNANDYPSAIFEAMGQRKNVSVPTVVEASFV